MNVNYQLTVEDLVAFSSAFRRFASRRVSGVYWYLILPTLMVVLAVSIGFGPAAVFTLLFGAVRWIVELWAQREFHHNVFSPDHVSVQTLPMRVTLSDDGARFGSDAGHIFYRWRFIRDVSRYGAYICFTITPIERMYIPARAFRDDSHLNEFLTTAQSHANTRNA